MISPFTNAPVQLGLGLIGIGRPWGHVPGEVPPEKDALALLERAYDLGIRYFDTAPSYGFSEERLGTFLKPLSAAQRKQITVATKFGEHWDFAKGEAFVDQSFDALRRSLETSLQRLGQVDALQLHKTTPEVLKTADLARAWEFAAGLGIAILGTSVKDLESAKLTLEDPKLRIMQLPFNQANTGLAEALELASARDVAVAVNRPFGMGTMLYGDAPMGKADAFAFVLARRFRGAILTGTKSIPHLEENCRAFRVAVARIKWPVASG
jgi:aryl-alcohol dehydrogenase-like predicted oxidoreductase